MEVMLILMHFKKLFKVGQIIGMEWWLSGRVPGLHTQDPRFYPQHPQWMMWMVSGLDTGEQLLIQSRES